MCAIASSRGSTPEIAKKQVCRTVLVRPPKTGVARDLAGVDDENPQFLVDDLLLLSERGRLIPGLVGFIGAVEQEDRARRGDPQHVLPFEQGELVTGDEARGGDQIGRADRLGAEAQMGNRLGAGLVGIIDEIALGVAPGVLGDDLDAVLVGADRAIGDRARRRRRGDRRPALDGEIRIDGEARVRDIVIDAEGEAVATGEWLASRRASSSNAALAMAGVKSLDDRP